MLFSISISVVNIILIDITSIVDMINTVNFKLMDFHTAWYIGCSTSTAKRYLKAKGLPVVYVGRKPTAVPVSIDQWAIKNNKREPA